MMIKPLKPRNLSDDISDQLLFLMKSGDLRPGDKLPPERELAEDLRVSRTAVREALCALESPGYIESRVGEGTFVSDLTLKGLTMPFSHMLSRDEQVIEDIIEVRLILERRNASLAAQRAREDELAQIRAVLDDMARAIETGGPVQECDEAFHFALVRATHNQALVTIFELCRGLLHKTISAVFEIPNQPRAALEGHEAIYQALLAREPARAEAAMEQHLRQIYRSINRAPAPLP